MHGEKQVSVSHTLNIVCSLPATPCTAVSRSWATPLLHWFKSGHYTMINVWAIMLKQLQSASCAVHGCSCWLRGTTLSFDCNQALSFLGEKDSGRLAFIKPRLAIVALWSKNSTPIKKHTHTVHTDYRTTVKNGVIMGGSTDEKDHFLRQVSMLWIWLWCSICRTRAKRVYH